jgi:lysozyme family protein
MASFAESIPIIFRHEGGYVNDPNDRGGETNHGISKRAYPDLDIRNLTKDDAAAIYYEDYWKPLQLGSVNDEDVAGYLLDCAVNHGAGRAGKFAQKVANAFGAELAIDSVMGPLTIAAINGIGDQRAYLYGLIGERAAFFCALAREARRQRRFIRGWLTRAFYPLR